MIFRSLYYLLQDAGISLLRRATKRKSYVCKFAFNSCHFTPDGYSSCCENASKGSFDKFSSVNDHYFSESSRELRKRVLRGDYSRCPETCITRLYAERPPKGQYNPMKSFGRIVVGNGRIFGEFRHLRDELLSSTPLDTFHMASDDSCDIFCSMCRTSPSASTCSKENVKRSWEGLYENLSTAKIVCLGGTGEPLIQKNIINFLSTTTEEMAPKLEQVYIISHANHLTPDLWNKITPYVRERVALHISVDAATAETYKKIRRGANFDKLLSNLEFFKDVQLTSFILSMVVQEDNFKEMPMFIDLAERFNAQAMFAHINHYPDKACHLSGHKDHDEFLQVISSDRFESPSVIGNFIYQLRENHLKNSPQ